MMKDANGGTGTGVVTGNLCPCHKCMARTHSEYAVNAARRWRLTVLEARLLNSPLYRRLAFFGLHPMLRQLWRSIVEG